MRQHPTEIRLFVQITVEKAAHEGMEECRRSPHLDEFIPVILPEHLIDDVCRAQ